MSEQAPEGHSNLRAEAMFFVALLLLACVAIILPHATSSDGFTVALIELGWFWPWTFLLLWGIILVEGIVGVFQAPDGIGKAMRRFLWTAFLPPLRMAFASNRPNTHVWFPRSGWMPVDKDSAQVMEMVLAIPMLLITLLILPVLIVEFVWKDQIADMVMLAGTVHLVTAVIWFAFALEFVMLVGVAGHKVLYCKQHWVNIVIILLPVIAFLRMLRLTQLVRMIRAGKMLRVYRLKGIYVRALRTATLLNLVDRIMRRNPDRFLKSLDRRINELETELDELKLQADEVRKEIAEKKEEEKSERR